MTEQNDINREIARMYDPGQALKGTLFAHVLTDALREVAAGEDVPSHRLFKRLIRKLKGDNAQVEKG